MQLHLQKKGFLSFFCCANIYKCVVKEHCYSLEVIFNKTLIFNWVVYSNYFGFLL